MVSQTMSDESKTEFSVGDTVEVRYTGSFRGREHVVEGTVVEDPYQHRSTPEGALDLECVNEDGETYKARVKEDGRFSGLHHATQHHDHRKGSVEEVTLVEPAETETELTNEFDTVDEAVEAAEDLHEAMDEVSGKPHVHVKRLDEDAVETGFAEGAVTLRLTTDSRRLSAEAMRVLADAEADVEHIGESETWIGEEWLLWVPVERLADN